MSDGELSRTESTSDRELLAALDAASRIVTPTPEDYTDYTLNLQVARRNFSAGVAVAAAAGLAPNMTGFENPHPEPSTSSTNQPPTPDEHDSIQPHEGDGHTENELTPTNVLTAFGVSANFAEMLAESTLTSDTGGEGHGKTRLGRRPLGPIMIIQSAAGELVRLMVLLKSSNPTDHKTALHEAQELAKSLTIASCLPVLAEAASIIKAEPRPQDKIETPVVKRIVGFFSPEISEEPVIRPTIEATVEEWERYANEKLRHFYERIALIGGSTATQATFTTTYNSSAVANELKKGAAEEYAEWIIASEIHRRKQKDPSGQINVREVYDIAKKASDKMVNDPTGLNCLVIALCSNWNGNDFPLADPPNIFNAIAHFGELPRTMTQGFGLKIFSNLLAFNFFLSRYTGASNALQNEAFFLGQFFSSSVKGIKALGTIFSEMKREDLVAQTDRLLKQWEDLNNNGGGISKLAELMKTISSVEHRTPLHLAKEETVPGRTIARIKRSFGRGSSPKETTRSKESLREAWQLFLSELSKGRNIPRKRGEVQNFLLQNLSPLQDFLLEYQLDHPDERKSKELADIFRHLEGFIHAGTERSISEAIELIGQTTITREGDLKRFIGNITSGNYLNALRILNNSNALNLGPAVLEMNQRETGDDSRHEVLTETGKEVARALSIQIPNVEALVTVVKYILDKPALKSLPFNVKSGIVLMVTAQISRVADNVAAYLFGEKTLEALAGSEFGTEIKNNAEFMASLHRQALYAAIVGGGLSKFGNGPNFLQNRLEIEIGDDGVIVINPKKLPIKDTFKNVYAELLTFMVCGLGVGDISLYAPKQKASQPTH